MTLSKTKEVVMKNVLLKLKCYNGFAGLSNRDTTACQDMHRYKFGKYTDVYIMYIGSTPGLIFEVWNSSTGWEPVSKMSVGMQSLFQAMLDKSILDNPHYDYIQGEYCGYFPQGDDT